MTLKLTYQMNHAANLFGRNIKNYFQDLFIPKPDITIFTDASEIGWGITDGHKRSGGQWAQHERMHINILELKAPSVRIRTYYRNRSYNYIRVMTALQQLHILIIKVILSLKNAMKLPMKYSYGVLKIIILAHIPRKHNLKTDKFYRKFNNNTEWQLNPKVFIEITNKFGYPEIDLFCYQNQYTTSKLCFLVL